MISDMEIPEELKPDIKELSKLVKSFQKLHKGRVTSKYPKPVRNLVKKIMGTGKIKTTELHRATNLSGTAIRSYNRSLKKNKLPALTDGFSQVQVLDKVSSSVKGYDIELPIGVTIKKIPLSEIALLIKHLQKRLQ